MLSVPSVYDTVPFTAAATRPPLLVPIRPLPGTIDEGQCPETSRDAENGCGGRQSMNAAESKCLPPTQSQEDGEPRDGSWMSCITSDREVRPRIPSLKPTPLLPQH